MTQLLSDLHTQLANQAASQEHMSDHKFTESYRLWEALCQGGVCDADAVK